MIGTQTSSVAPGYTVDSKITTPPRPMTLPTVRLAASSGLRSGRLARSIGVGTVTMKTLQLRRSLASSLKLSIVLALGSSGVPSSVWSLCCRSSLMHPALTSKPKCDRQRQAHIAQSDHGNVNFLRAGQYSGNHVQLLLAEGDLGSYAQATPV